MRSIFHAAAVGLAILAFSGIAHAQTTKLDASKIEQLTGLKGTMNDKEGVFKVSYPRADLEVVSDGVKITPPMGLTCWVSFMQMGDHAVCMGDTVLTEDQVNPVLSAALDNGLRVTALHNHFFWDSPKVYFMHIGGMGDLETLATGIGKVYATLKATAQKAARPTQVTIDPSRTTLDPAKLDALFHAKGEFAKGVYKVTFGRVTRMHGQEMGNAMGVNTWAAFAGSDDKSAVMGDFAMTENELQPVLKALRAANINIVAIHNHMTGESPKIMFLHFWGIGPASELAAGLNAARSVQAQ
jgi:hypothetical protein